MATNIPKIPVNINMEAMSEKYPVQRFVVNNRNTVSEKEVKDAIKGINPDKNSLNWRG